MPQLNPKIISFIQEHFGPIQESHFLAKGLSNDNYHLVLQTKNKLKNSLFVKQLKQNHIEPEQRIMLQDIHRHCYKQGLSSKLLLTNDKLKLEVHEYCPEPNLEKHKCPPLDKLQILATVLINLHSTDISIMEASSLPFQALHNNLKTLAQQSKQQLPKSILKLAKDLDQQAQDNGTHNVLCHGDLSFSNILVAAKIKIIDWEYARLAPPEYDLAACICINRLNEHDSQILIDSYSNHAPNDYQLLPKLIKQYIEIFTTLNKLWTQAQA